MDEHLLTQVSMDDIRLRFKRVSKRHGEIKQAVMLSGEVFLGDFRGPYADTLLKARKVSFQFDMIRLLNKDYDLKKIQISDGFLNILFDQKGHHNLNIWNKA